jgi:hypothetical protein
MSFVMYELYTKVSEEPATSMIGVGEYYQEIRPHIQYKLFCDGSEDIYDERFPASEHLGTIDGNRLSYSRDNKSKYPLGDHDKRGIPCCPQSLQENAGILPQIAPRLVSSVVNSLLMHWRASVGQCAGL